jgi:hypothetical protein
MKQRRAAHVTPGIRREDGVPRSLASFTLVLFALVCAGAAHAQTLRPLVYIEADPAGPDRYVRVMERRHTAFTPARSILDLANSPRINIDEALATLVRGVYVRNAEYGINVRGSGPVSIDHFGFYDWNGGGERYGGAVKINRSSGAATYIQRVYADGREAPDPSYDRSNTDFIGIERNGGPVFVRYATGRRFGDAGIDAKSDVALMNVTIDGAHRALRAWSNTTITIANAIINVPEGQEQVWVQGTSARVRYYNVLWCIGAANPARNNSDCTPSPTAIGVDDVTLAQARQQITALSSNPLAGNSFFATQIDRIVIEYSRDAGATWTVMAAGGSSGQPPLGDTRYRIPFNLTSATYLFRAHFERNGARVGATTTVNEAGAGV